MKFSPKATVPGCLEEESSLPMSPAVLAYIQSLSIKAHLLEFLCTFKSSRCICLQACLLTTVFSLAFPQFPLFAKPWVIFIQHSMEGDSSVTAGNK